MVQYFTTLAAFVLLNPFDRTLVLLILLHFDQIIPKTNTQLIKMTSVGVILIQRDGAAVNMFLM